MSKQVKKFYDQGSEKEWDRLQHPYSRLELVTTLDLITKHFPSQGTICDVGSGPGRYSMELLKKGYQVTMVDLSRELLEIAKREITRASLPPAAKVLCASATDLSELATESFDAVLLMGPLYHLLDAEERQKALKETYRLLKKGGVACIAYLSSWGGLRYFLKRYPEKFEDLSFPMALLKEGSLSSSFGDFTECFFSSPSAAQKEIEEAGFTVTTFIGCEGVASGYKSEVEEIARRLPQAYESLVKLVRETCEKEPFRSTAEHLHFVATKRDSL